MKFTCFCLLALAASTLAAWEDGDDGVDRPNGDMPGMPITMDKDAVPSDCAMMCVYHQSALCKAWVYLKPFCDGRVQPVCYLKAELSKQQYKECAVSQQPYYIQATKED